MSILQSIAIALGWVLLILVILFCILWAILSILEKLDWKPYMELYARKKCEEQKLACAENFKDKSRDNTRYRTAVLNTKNVCNE